jgi:predicted ArsR family transcriptional regulator
VVSAADPRSDGGAASAAVIGVVLAEIRDMGPATVAEIARGTGLSPSTVRRHLADLESSGLVESSNYQRRARVYLPA